MFGNTPPGVQGIGHLADVFSPAAPHTSLKEQHLKGKVRKMQDRITPGAHPLRCPFCEVHELEPSGNDSARCTSCGAFLGGALLVTLVQISALPLAVGRHACECGHPEMRLLPDGVYRCPACASEVTPVSHPS
jgi:ribosomal protein L37AE/L43A